MAGFSGFGVQFKRGNNDGPPETFTTVGEATSISGPGMERDTIDVTSHDSPNRFREWVGGLVDGGEVSFEVNWDPSIHVGLIADFEDPLPRSYQIVMPTPPGGRFNFEGFITNMGHEFPLDDKMSADFTFKISGKPTFTP